MNISLTPALEKAVKAKVESGHYNNASEVVREALRDSLRHDHENGWLLREAGIGYAQLESNEMIRVASKKTLKALIRKNQ
jgi:antitoxin ParD1/3/4